MNLAICFLATTCLAGADVEPPASQPAVRMLPRSSYAGASRDVAVPVGGPQATSVVPCHATANCPCNSEKPSFLCRLLRRLEGRLCQSGHCGSPCNPCDCTPHQKVVVASVEPTHAPAPVAQVQLPATTEIRKQYLDRVGHEEDYSWVTGQLCFVHADGGLWVVRYATVDTEDRFGGSVVLASVVNMKNYREGDLVTVHGSILKAGRASKYLGGALYRAEGIDIVERSDP